MIGIDRAVETSNSVAEYVTSTLLKAAGLQNFSDQLDTAEKDPPLWRSDWVTASCQILLDYGLPATMRIVQENFQKRNNREAINNTAPLSHHLRLLLDCAASIAVYKLSGNIETMYATKLLLNGLTHVGIDAIRNIRDRRWNRTFNYQ